MTAIAMAATEMVATNNRVVVWMRVVITVSNLLRYLDLFGFDAGRVGTFGPDAIDRDQRQAEVSHSLKQAVER